MKKFPVQPASPLDTTTSRHRPRYGLYGLLVAIGAVGALIALVFLRTPDMTTPGQAAMTTLPETGSEGHGVQASGQSASTATAAEPESSDWERDRELDLQNQRRVDQLAPYTPGVNNEDYVSEGDDSSYAKDDEENGAQQP